MPTGGRPPGPSSGLRVRKTEGYVREAEYPEMAVEGCIGLILHGISKGFSGTNRTTVSKVPCC